MLHFYEPWKNMLSERARLPKVRYFMISLIWQSQNKYTLKKERSVAYRARRGPRERVTAYRV
jgi:hypothetical protein